jgi:hypothetical protein
MLAHVYRTIQAIAKVPAKFVVLFLLMYLTTYPVVTEAVKHGNDTRSHLSRKRLFSSYEDAVMLAYMNHRWHRQDDLTVGPGTLGFWPDIPDTFFLKGTKQAVSDEFRPLIVKGKTSSDVTDEIGEGQRAYQSAPEDSCASVYRDKTGVRLFLNYEPMFHGGFGAVLLSNVSRHPAKRIRQNLARLRTGEGLRLGDTQTRVERRLGSPSERDRFGGYDIVFYLEKPQKIAGSSQVNARQGNAQAFMYRAHKVVEIWMVIWTTERSG